MEANGSRVFRSEAAFHLGQSGRVAELELVRTEIAPSARWGPGPGARGWRATLGCSPPPSLRAATLVMDSRSIVYCKGADLRLYRPFSNLLTDFHTKSNKAACGVTPAKPGRAGKAGPAEICAGKTQAASGPPRPGPHLTPAPPGCRENPVAVERKHCACPAARPGAGCPKQGFPRLPEPDHRTGVRGGRRGELAFLRRALPSPARLRGTQVAERQPGAMPPMGTGTRLAGEGARGGLAGTRDCPRRFGQPSSAPPWGREKSART